MTSLDVTRCKSRDNASLLRGRSAWRVVLPRWRCARCGPCSEGSALGSPSPPEGVGVFAGGCGVQRHKFERAGEESDEDVGAAHRRAS